ncbi:MAG: cytochrome c3 family protein [Holophaga sp.]|nr:cytochrome c3 family protein [Holophaga sp.]
MKPTRLKERISPMSNLSLTRLATASRLLFFAGLLPFAQAAAPPTPMTADLHKAKGVTCVDCHGNAKKKTFVAAQTCLRCHGPAEDLVKKTAAVKPENPHDSPHWGPAMECNICHRQHEKPVNWCNHCHAYGFKVP